jgi:hypothetical protein
MGEKEPIERVLMVTTPRSGKLTESSITQKEQGLQVDIKAKGLQSV